MTAAGAEEAQTRTGSKLAGLHVRDIMAPDPVVVAGWTTVDSFLHDVALKSRHSCFPVRDWTGAIMGLISLPEHAA